MENLLRNLNLKNSKEFWTRLTGFLAIYFIAFLIIISRRPDVIVNPQFWAEDGKVWYEMAYNDGAISPIFATQSGYYQTISRLIAGLSLYFPLSDAPLIFNLFAISCKIIIVYFLLSSRLSGVIPSLAIRVLLAFIYLALPSSFEVNANLTNVQWHLALLSFLILISKPAENLFWKAFDFLVFFLSALSGPFCLFLLPIGLYYWWDKRQKWTLYLSLILFFGCLIQGYSVLTIDRVTSVPLGFDLNLFSRIIGGQIFLSSILGTKIFEVFFHTESWSVWALVVNVIGFSLLIYSFVKASIELKLFIVFSALICVGALFSPSASEADPQWQILSRPAVGSRYWFIPIFCFLTVLIELAITAGNRFFKKLAILLLLIAPVGIIKDWEFPPYRDYEFQRYAKEFESVPSGTPFVIPINPNWDMKLIKREEK